MIQAKVAVIHPHLRLGGGSEACALWILEALRESFDVSLVTSHPVDFLEFNRFYGTAIGPDEIPVIVIPPPIVLDNPNRFAALRAYRLSRYCRRVSAKFDVMFSTYSPMDFGKPGIQYILDPHFNEELLKMLNPTAPKSKGWFYKDSALRRFYLGLSNRLAGFTREGMKENLTLVDSNWTGAAVRDCYGLDPITVYPPVLTEYPAIPWDKREDGFVCLGRIVPEKQIERAIEIVGRVRRSFPSTHLHILGKVGDVAFANRLKKIVSDNKAWLTFEADVPLDKKADLLSRHKYGIHGKENEPFGIAVAELASAGCVVWVPVGGGQVEIVDHPLLIYSSIEDGQKKIEQIIRDSVLMLKIREHLAKQARLFSTVRFQSEIRKTVLSFIESGYGLGRV